MKTIEIDFEVYKHLVMELKNEEDSFNDVLRRKYGLKTIATNSPLINGKTWSKDGVSLPHKTELRMVFYGKTYYGKINDGSFEVNGKKFSSPSPAAMEITKGRTGNPNGWRYWDCKRPGDTSWIHLGELREQFRKN